MKRIFSLVLLILAFANLSHAAPVLSRQYTFTSSGTSDSLNIGSIGASYYKVVYSTFNGTSSACSFTLQGSVNDSTWPATVISATTCTSDGVTAYTAAGTANSFVRLNVSSLTTTGTLRLTVLVYIDVAIGSGSTSGTAGQVAFFDTPTTLTSDSDLSFATDTLTFTKGIGSTNFTSPILYGGSAVGSSLSLRATSGVGTTGNVSIGVGNNGATTIATFASAGITSTVNFTGTNGVYSGNLALGGATLSSAYLINGITTIDVNNPRGFNSALTTTAATDGGGAISYEGKVNTSAGAYTLANSYVLLAEDGTLGAGSTVTNQHGIQVMDMTIGTNNYGIRSTVTAGTNKWNLYIDGTASNYFAGSVTNAGSVVVNGSSIPTGYTFSVDAGTSRLNGRVYTANLTTSSGLQTGVVCVSSTGELINDSVACLASSARFKHDISNVDLGLKEVLSLRPVNFYYNYEKEFDNQNHNMQQIGFIAEEAEKIDSRLVGYDNEGNVRTFRYENYTAVLTKAIQELNEKVTSLEGKLN